MLVRWLAFCFLGSSALGQLTLSGPTVITHPTPHPYMRFGAPISIDDGKLAVGVPQFSQGPNTGQVLVYSGSGATWNVISTFAGQPPAEHVGLGRAIDLEFPYVLASDFLIGDAHLMPYGSPESRLTPVGSMPGFGESVSQVGTSWLLVGAPGAQSRVAVFTSGPTNWIHTATLQPPGGATDDAFGKDMVSDGSIVAIGARLTDSGSLDAGAVHLFEDVSGGVALTYVQTITAPHPEPGAQFGAALDVQGDTLIVGQPYGPLGHVFVFTRQGSGWGLQQELELPGGAIPNYGIAVQVEGNIAAVSSSIGRTDLFRRQEGVWSWKLMVLHSPVTERGLALSADSLAIGCSSEGSTYEGAIFVYGLTDLPAIESLCFGDVSSGACPCGNAGAPGRGCQNSQIASGALLEGWGDASLSHDTVHLSASGTPLVASGLYFQGTANVAGGGGVPFGDGLRCVAGATLRLAVRTASGGASSYPQLGDQSISIVGQVPTGGATRYYQLWYRDVAAFCTPSGFNLTNGVRIAWTP